MEAVSRYLVAPSRRLLPFEANKAIDAFYRDHFADSGLLLVLGDRPRGPPS